MEAIVVFPILILMIWGIYHMHTAAFYSARSAMATRHAAWVKSVDKNATATQAGLDAFFGKENSPIDSMSCVIITSLTANQAGLDERETPSLAAQAAESIFPMGLLQDFLDSFAIFQPFTRNALSELTFKVNSPISNFEDNKHEITSASFKNRAYFPCRYKDLYFHNSWDFFKVDIAGDLDEAVSSAESGMNDANDNFSDQASTVDEDDLSGEAGGNIYNYDDYQDALKKWRDWLGNR